MNFETKVTSLMLSPKEFSLQHCPSMFQLSRMPMGGEIVVGLEDDGEWIGFTDEESANNHIAHLEDVFGNDSILQYSFLKPESRNGLLLLIEVEKSGKIIQTSDKAVYLRRSAQSLKQDTPEKIRRIELDKGLYKYENTKTQADDIELENTNVTIEFILDIVPTSEPIEWLKKQKLCVEGKATVAGYLLFSDEPQVELPKAAIKIYRYKSKEKEGTRETLVDPIAVEGSAYSMIFEAVRKVKEITERIPIVGAKGLEKISYPDVAIHEIITNAIIHRDYRIDDDV